MARTKKLTKPGFFHVNMLTAPQKVGWDNYWALEHELRAELGRRPTEDDFFGDMDVPSLAHVVSEELLKQFARRGILQLQIDTAWEEEAEEEGVPTIAVGANVDSDWDAMIDSGMEAFVLPGPNFDEYIRCKFDTRSQTGSSLERMTKLAEMFM